MLEHVCTCVRVYLNVCENVFASARVCYYVSQVVFAHKLKGVCGCTRVYYACVRVCFVVWGTSFHMCEDMLVHN
jgi:hypothetical protein